MQYQYYGKGTDNICKFSSSPWILCLLNQGAVCINTRLSVAVSLGEGKIQETHLPVSAGTERAQCRLYICFMHTEQPRVNIYFNITTQIAVYHRKYRVQSPGKGHKGHYALVARDLSLFSFYSMPTTIY